MTHDLSHVDDELWLRSHGTAGRPHPSIVSPPARPPVWVAALVAYTVALSVGVVLKGLLV